jgi:hypothetical protein
MKHLRFHLILAGTLILGSALLVWAKHAGLVGGEIPVRGCMVMIGLALALYTNRAPKEVLRRTARGLAIQRVSGWTFVIAALVYAGLWLFAPLDVATIASMLVIAGAVAGVYVWCTLTRPKAA